MTFELAPGSESIPPRDVAFSVICAGGTAAGEPFGGANGVSANAGGAGVAGITTWTNI